MAENHRDILGSIDETTQRRYTYFLTNLHTNEIIAELPFLDVSYSTVLSSVGEFSGNVLINEETKTYDIRRATLPRETGLYVLRDRQPVWGGIIWKRRYNAASRRVDIVASTFESYLEKRIQKETLLFSGDDQLNIARWLLNTDNVASDILATVSEATSPRSRERQFYGWEYNTVMDEMTRLGDLIDGFDWNVLIGRSPLSQEITRRFEFFYPKRGVSAQDSQLLFEYPGSIRDFTVDEDAKSGANILYALGAGEGADRKVASAKVQDQLDAGVPPLEETRSYSSVVEDATLQAHADSDRDRLTAPVTVFEVVVDARTEPELGTYEVGDWARFILKDDFIDPPIDQYARITAIEVNVENGTGLERVTIKLGGDEVTSDEEEGSGA